MSALWSTDRPEFLERVAKLAGGTTFRTPAGGRTNEVKELPDAQAIAAALSMSRLGPEDVGPDVAYCWALQSDAYRNKVTRQVSINLRSHRFRTMAAHRLKAAEAAWTVVIHNRRASVELPSDIRPADFDRLLLAAIAELYDSALAALSRAERKYHEAS